jgi:hypothetical protein
MCRLTSGLSRACRVRRAVMEGGAYHATVTGTSWKGRVMSMIVAFNTTRVRRADTGTWSRAQGRVAQAQGAIVQLAAGQPLSWGRPKRPRQPRVACQPVRHVQLEGMRTARKLPP